LPNEVEFGNHERRGKPPDLRPAERIPEVSRDMTFDREIPTPGLITPQHRYSMRMVGFMEMLLRGFIMPRPIPVPIRQAMFRLWQKGFSIYNEGADSAAGSHSTLTKSGFPGRIPASLSDFQFSSRARTRPRRDIECEHLVPMGNL
jgi:hypothetical protein